MRTPNTYKIMSIKGDETIEGTAADAVRAALAHDERMQPAYGTTIAVRRGDADGTDIISTEDVTEAIGALRDDALEHDARAQVDLCDQALAGGNDDAYARCLIAIVSTRVTAWESEEPARSSTVMRARTEEAKTFWRGIEASYAASLTEALAWAKTAEDGDYLVKYEDTGMTNAEDPGSRCGYDDLVLEQIDRVLLSRDLRLTTDDRGLVAAPSR